MRTLTRSRHRTVIKPGYQSDSASSPSERPIGMSVRRERAPPDTERNTDDPTKRFPYGVGKLDLDFNYLRYLTKTSLFCRASRSGDLLVVSLPLSRPVFFCVQNCSQQSSRRTDLVALQAIRKDQLSTCQVVSIPTAIVYMLFSTQGYLSRTSQEIAYENK